jgi:hypothetical protein
MTERRPLQALDRLIRVREIRARQALAVAGQLEGRRGAEAAVVARIERLLARAPMAEGAIAAQAGSARAAGDVILGLLAENGRVRLAATEAEKTRALHALAHARAAVDAAIARRRDREQAP